MGYNGWFFNGNFNDWSIPVLCRDLDIKWPVSSEPFIPDFDWHIRGKVLQGSDQFAYGRWVFGKDNRGELPLLDEITKGFVVTNIAGARAFLNARRNALLVIASACLHTL